MQSTALGWQIKYGSERNDAYCMGMGTKVKQDEEIVKRPKVSTELVDFVGRLISLIKISLAAVPSFMRKRSVQHCVAI